MNAACSCGAVDPNATCPVSQSLFADGFLDAPHSVGQCKISQTSQQMMRKMDALETAWALLKAKEDAPNYRKATGPKKCGNCKAWDDSATDDPMTGHCEWYDFTCRADHTCDAWAGE